MTVRLGTRSGKYDPTNTGSPYAPNVLPMRQIRAAPYNGGVPAVPRPHRGIRPAVVGVNNAEVTLECVDAFAWLANVTIAEPLYAEDTAGQRILDVLTDIGWSASRSTRCAPPPNQSTSRRSTSQTAKRTCSTGFQHATDSELGDLYVDGAGIITFRDRRQKLEIARHADRDVRRRHRRRPSCRTSALDPSYGISTS
jgi:hypothetical protein